MSHGDRIDGRRMSSKSLNHLYITDLFSFSSDFHIRIFAAGLISLQLFFLTIYLSTLEIGK
jgi:hypothetical protein